MNSNFFKGQLKFFILKVLNKQPVHGYLLMQKISEDWAVSPEKLCSRIVEKTVFLGSGTEVYGETFKKNLGPRALFAPPELSLPRAVHVARLSLPKFQAGRTLDLFSFTPVYVRRSEAEIHYEAKERKGTEPKP